MDDTDSLGQLSDELKAITATIEPQSILAVVGDDIALPKAPRRIDYTPNDAAGLIDAPVDTIADLAILDSGAALSGRQVPIVLSRLRDFLARRVLVVVRADAGDAWSRHALIGCGYTHMVACRHGETAVDLFQFDIATYKHTPDWLNPSNWANPELWDKYRW